jgi:hypothetical protein
MRELEDQLRDQHLGEGGQRRRSSSIHRQSNEGPPRRDRRSSTSSRLQGYQGPFAPQPPSGGGRHIVPPDQLERLINAPPDLDDDSGHQLERNSRGYLSPPPTPYPSRSPRPSLQFNAEPPHVQDPYPRMGQGPTSRFVGDATPRHRGRDQAPRPATQVKIEPPRYPQIYPSQRNPPIQKRRSEFRLARIVCGEYCSTEDNRRGDRQGGGGSGYRSDSDSGGEKRSWMRWKN